jgi:hypothetical protein
VFADPLGARPADHLVENRKLFWPVLKRPVGGLKVPIVERNLDDIAPAIDDLAASGVQKFSVCFQTNPPLLIAPAAV